MARVLRTQHGTLLTLREDQIFEKLQEMISKWKEGVILEGQHYGRGSCTFQILKAARTVFTIKWKEV